MPRWRFAPGAALRALLTWPRPDSDAGAGCQAKGAGRLLSALVKCNRRTGERVWRSGGAAALAGRSVIP